MVINYEEYFEQAGLVDIQTAIPSVVVDLKYATSVKHTAQNVRASARYTARAVCG